MQLKASMLRELYMASRAQLEVRLNKTTDRTLIVAISEELRKRGFEPYTLHVENMADAKDDCEADRILTEYQEIRFELQNSSVVQLYKQLRRSHSRILNANEEGINTESVMISNREQQRIQHIHCELTNRGFDPYQLYHGGKLRSEEQILEDVQNGTIPEKEINPYEIQPPVQPGIYMELDMWHSMRDRITDAIVSSYDSQRARIVSHDVNELVGNVDNIILHFCTPDPEESIAESVAKSIEDDMEHHVQEDGDYDLSADIDHGLGITDTVDCEGMPNHLIDINDMPMKGMINVEDDLKKAADKSIAFRKELEILINMFSKENGSDTPDFILANYMANMLGAFDTAVQARTEWYESETPINEMINPTTGDNRVTSPVAGNVLDECVGPEGVHICGVGRAGDTIEQFLNNMETVVPSAPEGELSEEQIAPGPIDEEELWANTIEEDKVKTFADKYPNLKVRTLADDVEASMRRLGKTKAPIIRSTPHSRIVGVLESGTPILVRTKDE